MARELWLLRHADAEPHGTRPDAERVLTARGERQAHLAGEAIARAGVDFEAILVSPKARARQTAECAVSHWGESRRAKVREHAPLAGGFDLAGAREALSEIDRDGRLLLVGHEPDLSRLVGDLTGALVDLKKGGLAVVRLRGAGGELIVLMRPGELALIADTGAAGDLG
jgi:phosphohistidine phosphatase